MYPRIYARAGLVALIFSLIISLASAAPIPIHTSTHSDLIQSWQDRGRLAQFPPKSSISSGFSATAGVVTHDNGSIDTDNQLVRRNAHINAKIREGFKKLGTGIVHAVHKVGDFMKHTGATILKFGLKVASSVGHVLAKAIGFVPGLGNVIGKVMEASSKLTGFISDKIHAHLGKKLEKGMTVMNKAEHTMKFIPRDLSQMDNFWY